MNSLKYITAPVRLGWHSVAAFSATAAIAYFADNDIVRVISTMGSCIAIGCYTHSLESFAKTMHLIKKSGSLEERVVNPQLTYYCNRQGARTAAALYGLENQFDKYMHQYKGEMMHRFLPHL